MFRFSENCTEALMLSRDAFFGLYDNYRELEQEAVLQRDRANTEEKLKNEAVEKYNKENLRKKRWRRVALVEGAGIGATILVLILFL
jgi:hypothetical protein